MHYRYADVIVMVSICIQQLVTINTFTRQIQSKHIKNSAVQCSLCTKLPLSSTSSIHGQRSWYNL